MLSNATVHYRVHNSPPLVPLLSQINPVSATCIVILPSHLRLGLHLVTFRFSHQNPCTNLSSPHSCSTLGPLHCHAFFLSQEKHPMKSTDHDAPQFELKITDSWHVTPCTFKECTSFEEACCPPHVRWLFPTVLPNYTASHATTPYSYSWPITQRLNDIKCVSNVKKISQQMRLEKETDRNM